MSREAYLEKLEQFILDESRIVTYKLASRELKISVNEAKQLLHEFLEEHKTESLHATYFLSGTEEKGPERSLRVLVVTKKNLEEAKENLSEVTSCHVYSVSKTTVEDEVALYRVDLQYNRNDEECSNYVIKHPHIEIKAPVLSKTNGIKKEVKAAISKKEQTSFFKNVSTNSVKKNEKTVPVESSDLKEAANPVESSKSKTQSPVKKSPAKKSNSEAKPHKSNTLAAMWQKKEDKSKKSENSKSDVNGKTKSPQETKQVPKNNILSMFSKQAEKKADSSSKKSSSTSECSKTIEDSVSSKEKLSVKSVSPIKTEKTKETKPPKESSDKKKKANQRQTKAAKHKKDVGSDEDFEPKKKKHRRICTFEDSDSDSESEEAQDRVQRGFLAPEEPMETETLVKPPTPVSDDEEPIPPTPPVVLSKGKRKVWKTVQKTFEDEDGFFVTKQEKVLVSEDDEDPIPQSSKPKDVNKQNQFTYRKQASLTSFFKQK